MLEILPIEPDDEVIICDYIEQEWLNTGGDERLSSKIKNKMYAEISGENGVKVYDTESKRIVGFAIYYTEYYNNSGSVMLISFYVAKEYRLTKVNHMLMNNVIEYSKDNKILYIPLHSGSTIPSSVCKNGLIDKDRVVKWLDSTKDRYK